MPTSILLNVPLLDAFDVHQKTKLSTRPVVV